MPANELQTFSPLERLAPISLSDEPGLLPGSVCMQYVRCGKPTCACRTGKLHGPYYYRVWREDGVVQKAYVRPDEIESVLAACAAYGQLSRALRSLRRQRQELTERLEKDLRQARRMLERRNRFRAGSSGRA